jgi:hypothetical protein
MLVMCHNRDMLIVEILSGWTATAAFLAVWLGRAINHADAEGALRAWQ